MRMVGAENLRSTFSSLGDGVAAGEGIAAYEAMALKCERLPLSFVALSSRINLLGDALRTALRQLRS